MTAATATQASRPFVTRSRVELERAVIAAARALVRETNTVSIGEYLVNRRWLREAVTALDEWERLRAEAAG